MQINDLIFHPCSLDILEFKITGIHSYETHTIYSATTETDVLHMVIDWTAMSYKFGGTAQSY